MSDNLIELEDLAKALEPSTPLIGLDLGSKTIGIALSDKTRAIASPIETLKRTKFTQDAEKLIALATQENAAAFIIGLPVNMDGSEGPRCQSTRAFVRNMAKHTKVPFVLWDERLSTAAVTRTLLEADTSRAKRAEVVDKLAASYILQGALDRLQHL
ncbi:MAG: Holliday junction resolvase RuvX [Hyphomicrobiales bacterium]